MRPLNVWRGTALSTTHNGTDSMPPRMARVLSKLHAGTNFVRAMPCNDDCQDGKVKHSLRHVVPFVTHNLRTVYEMRDTQCHA